MKKIHRVKSYQLEVGSSRERGQVLIIIILTLLVVSLVVLAVASRSVTDINISNVSDESARAFSAAEAGVEEAVEKIRSGSIPGGSQNISLPNNPNAGTYTVSRDAPPQSYLFPAPIPSDFATFQVYLSPKDGMGSSYTGNQICLLWGSENTTENPSLEATVIYRTGAGAITFTRELIPAAAGPCDRSIDAVQNNLGIARTFRFSHLLSLSTVPPVPAENRIFLRIRLLGSPFTPHYAGVTPEGGATLPPQGYEISATGGTQGQAQRKVEVLQTDKALPAIFDFALYNHSGTLSK